MARKALDDSSVDTKELQALWDTAGEMIERVGTVPAKVATSSAGAGATVVKRRVKSLVPKKTGNLRKGIVRKGEKSKTKGKKVYDITFDRGMNGTFQKPIKEPGKRGSSKTKQGYAYYPVSIDSGFITMKDGAMKYVPGVHFMRQGAESSQLLSQQAILQKLNEKLEIEWMKQQDAGG